MKKAFDYIKRNSLYILSVIIFTVFYCWYHTKIWVSSDHVTMIPFAKDFLKRNLLLKGWVAGSNNFFFTETIFYLPGLAMGISGYVLEAVLSSLTMALIVVMASAFFLRQKGILYVISYYSMVGIVVIGMSHILINSNSHNGLYVALLLELWFLFKFVEDKTGNYGYLIVFIVIGVLSLYSDTVALMGLVAPVVCLSVYMVFVNRKDADVRTRWLLVFSSTVLVYVLEKLFARLIMMLGGMETQGYPVKLVDIEEAKTRAVAWFEQIKITWGYAAWGSNILNHCYHVAIVGIMVLCAISVVYYLIKATMLNIESRELLCLLVIMINLGGCIFTNSDIHPRYCVLSFLFGVILALCFISEFATKLACDAKVVKVIVAMLLLLFIASVSASRLDAIIRMQPYAYLSETKNVAQFILDNDLGTGYGQFWCGPIMSGMVDYKYNVMPIYTCEDGFKKYGNLINKKWYEENDVHYTVTFQNDEENSAVGVKNEEIIGFLGEPDWVKDIYNYRIMYWDKDISDYLKR